VEVLRSALRHGVAAGDINHAVKGALFVEEIGEDPQRYLGGWCQTRFLDENDSYEE
jgi:hypothetical protein